MYFVMDYYHSLVLSQKIAGRRGFSVTPPLRHQVTSYTMAIGNRFEVQCRCTQKLRVLECRNKQLVSIFRRELA